ncbi:DUF961 family protein [Streptococcus gallolyticus]|uniref:DUF961 domain-containing protein n=1 Tax=Streptococcus gallolyticus TaxID=315405 RepID=A0A139R358_9STRE|nr:DUF961 family protein [Streptococcus gallolyticus]KXT64438.1 hypothetical protein SGADD02_02068 [Streptococcus gallolyticus]KXU09171.1 hypothetical protein SGADD03_00994 [Streptococcus gallolyticus]
MSVKFGEEAIEKFDVAKTLGTMKLMEIRPVYDWEDVVDEETGEKKRLPTDEILEYDVVVFSSANQLRTTVTVPVEAKGVEIDLDKNYRKPVTFSGLTARVWQSREVTVDRNGNRQVSFTSGVKFRATDFSLAGTNTQLKQNQGDQK